jgi:hypothetical protein
MRTDFATPHPLCWWQVGQSLDATSLSRVPCVQEFSTKIFLRRIAICKLHFLRLSWHHKKRTCWTYFTGVLVPHIQRNQNALWLAFGWGEGKQKNSSKSSRSSMNVTNWQVFLLLLASADAVAIHPRFNEKRVPFSNLRTRVLDTQQISAVPKRRCGVNTSLLRWDRCTRRVLILVLYYSSTRVDRVLEYSSTVLHEVVKGIERNTERQSKSLRLSLNRVYQQVL